MPNRRMPVYLRADQWRTVAACLEEWSTALKPAPSTRVERLTYKIAKAQIDEISAEIKRTAMKDAAP